MSGLYWTVKELKMTVMIQLHRSVMLEKSPTVISFGERLKK